MNQNIRDNEAVVQRLENNHKTESSLPLQNITENFFSEISKEPLYFNKNDFFEERKFLVNPQTSPKANQNAPQGFGRQEVILEFDTMSNDFNLPHQNLSSTLITASDQTSLGGMQTSGKTKINSSRTKKKIIGQIKKQHQNIKKNIPGLIIQKVRTSCFVYFDNSKLNIEYLRETILNYIDQIIRSQDFDQQRKESFIAFLGRYKAEWKTWTTIKAYFQVDNQNSKIFLSCILGFLEEQGYEDFMSWVREGKMKKSREVITASKSWYHSKFLQI